MVGREVCARSTSCLSALLWHLASPRAPHATPKERSSRPSTIGARKFGDRSTATAPPARGLELVWIRPHDWTAQLGASRPPGRTSALHAHPPAGADGGRRSAAGGDGIAERG
eukprot:1536008-Prymnesium_polylepis.1